MTCFTILLAILLVCVCYVALQAYKYNRDHPAAAKARTWEELDEVQ